MVTCVGCPDMGGQGVESLRTESAGAKNPWSEMGEGAGQGTATSSHPVVVQYLFLKHVGGGGRVD